MLVPVYDPRDYNLKDWVMPVAGLMSGSGSNIVKLLEHQHKLENQGNPAYRFVVLFSDRAESNAVKIGKQFDVPVVTRDIEAFYRARNAPFKDMSVRAEFDAATVNALEPYEAAAAAYGGYMSIATPNLVEAFIGVNVHPADLSVRTPEGKRKYTGDKAVAKAIVAGEKYIHSSTHIIGNQVDYGPVLLISKPMPVDPCKSPKENQDMLKEKGDWEIFPLTLELLARGRFQMDISASLGDVHEGKAPIYFDGKPMPNGIRLEELTK